MTTNADAFAINDLASQYQKEKLQRGEPQLILVASDGELYGHHQPFRDLFLAHLLKVSGTRIGAVPTFPAHFLQEYAPRRITRIRERTSWSCHHGVTRWMDSCGCAPFGGQWKAYLRQALDHLAHAIDNLYVDVVSPFISDPLTLRNQYISVMLGARSAEELISEMAGRRLPAEVSSRIHLLLEAQRERQRMFTSCGWFFEDFDRIEPKNNLAYAAHAVRLAQMAAGVDLAREARALLRHVESSRTGLRGDRVFARYLHRVQEPSRPHRHSGQPQAVAGEPAALDYNTKLGFASA
jgi:hypothetical protein